MADPSRAWRCRVCGYVHRGPKPPDVCPVCGASQEDFEPYTDAVEPSFKVAADKWRCLICQYEHQGTDPPHACPVCGALADSFEPLGDLSEKVSQTAEALQIVVVGAGIAGVAAVESIRRVSAAAEITLVSKEPELPYYRLNLTRYLAGEIHAQDLPIHPARWYEEQNVRLLLGAEASAIELEKQAVTLRDGRRLPFDRLLLAAGAHPFVPPIPGAERDGVKTLRTVQDADQILQASRDAARCVCIGGGILGLETAAALARRGADVTLLEGHGWLLPRQLNEPAGEILARHAAGLGIKLRKKARPREILGDDRARGVVAEDGTMVPADLVIITTGIRPNSCLARSAGLAVHRAVIVDDTLGTSHPGVFAAGDLAEHRGTLYGIWGPSQYQGRIAGLNMAGARGEFGGIPRSNTLKVLEIDLFSIGQITLDDASFHAVDQEIDGRYFRFVFRDHRLVGAILLGDTSLAVRVKDAIENLEDFSALLQKRPTAKDLLDCFAARGPEH